MPDAWRRVESEEQAGDGCEADVRLASHHTGDARAGIPAGADQRQGQTDYDGGRRHERGDDGPDQTVVHRVQVQRSHQFTTLISIHTNGAAHQKLDVLRRDVIRCKINGYIVYYV